MAEIINSLPEGTVLKGPRNSSYCIIDTLGHGNYGITYLATTEMEVKGQMGSFMVPVNVAVKEFFMGEINGRQGTEVTAGSQSGTFGYYKRKFMREAENLSRLHHPHIVKVLESFEANGTAYYVMEFIDGGSLEKHINKNGKMKYAKALHIARQIGEALSNMHQHKMLHLDVKPSNVMLRSTGEAVIIDFGLSKQFNKNGEPETSTTIGGGTPGYAPVEQANYQRGDGLPVTMDVYAFGATLFKMLTGERPPEASDVLNDGLPTFILERNGVPTATIDIIEKAMAPKVKDRYQSIQDVIDVLDGKKPKGRKTAGGDNKSKVTDDTVIPEKPKQKKTTGHDNESELTEYNSSVPKRSNKKKSLFDFVVFSSKIAKWAKYGVAAFGCLLLLVFVVRLIGGVMSQDEGLFSLNKKQARQHVNTTSTTSTSTQTFTANGVSFKMIRVEGGTFTMGATSEQGSYAYDDEKPAHQVTLSSYYIGETEVTQALWEAVMGKNPSCFEGSNLPVELVSWEDCQNFIRELNAITGKRFRLPTEAEWEFAARGGNKGNGSKYSGSSSVDRVAWYYDNSGSKTHDVKTKAANELGIYDMSGNVYEWCQDWYGSYSVSAQTNPTGASSGSDRVGRGGSWFSSAGKCRVSSRGSGAPDSRDFNLGLRLAL